MRLSGPDSSDDRGRAPGQSRPETWAIHSGPLTENSTHDYLLRLVARMLAQGWVPELSGAADGTGQVWTVTWRRKGE